MLAASKCKESAYWKHKEREAFGNLDHEFFYHHTFYVGYNIISIIHSIRFFIRRKFIKKGEKKILRKLRGSIYKNVVFLLAKNRYLVVIVFKMLKTELKFKYTILITIE